MQIYDSHNVFANTVRMICPIKDKKLIDKITASLKDFGIRYKELFRDMEVLYRVRRNACRNMEI